MMLPLSKVRLPAGQEYTTFDGVVLKNETPDIQFFDQAGEGVWRLVSPMAAAAAFVPFDMNCQVITLPWKGYCELLDAASELAAAKRRISDLENALDNWKKLRSDKGEVPKAEDKGGTLQKAFGQINRGWRP